MTTPDTAEILDPNPLSRELKDAADELACRIEHGEFDDLDEMQMADLKGLATMLSRWATRARALEHATPDTGANPPVLSLAPFRAGSLLPN
jgi:hypothetical protein